MHIDQLIRSKRKTFAIIVTEDGRLVVRAPLRATQAQVEAIVAQKESWISQKQVEVRIVNENKLIPHRFMDGESFLYLGVRYPLHIQAQATAQLKFDGRVFLLSKAGQKQAESLFEAWYRRQARQIFLERVSWYAGQHGFQYQQVRLSSARTRWGSCGAGGTLNLTWRLVMAPLDVIDYVVVHELVHLVEKSHSRSFWNRVAAIMPDYRQQRDWLKQNGNTLFV